MPASPLNNRRVVALAVLAAVVLGGLVLWFAFGRSSSGTTGVTVTFPTSSVSVSTPASTAVARTAAGATAKSTTGTSARTTAATVPGTGPRVTPPKGMGSVALADLPPEARHTVQLVLAGGPFPYARDGVVFENRERLLPQHASGYYHEYTVTTPGAAARGTRRVIQGHADELYYTDDHYSSFTWIVVA